MARSLAPFEVSTGAEPATAALGDQLSIRLKVLNPVHCKLTAQLSSAHHGCASIIRTKMPQAPSAHSHGWHLVVR